MSPVKPTPAGRARTPRQLMLGETLNTKADRRRTARAGLIKLAREAQRKGWTRRELAAYLGVSPRQLYRYLAGDGRLNPWIARVARSVKKVTRERIHLAT